MMEKILILEAVVVRRQVAHLPMRAVLVAKMEIMVQVVRVAQAEEAEDQMIMEPMEVRMGPMVTMERHHPMVDQQVKNKMMEIR